MIDRNGVDLSVLDKEALPRHVAIIMDGNGRWAKKRLKPRTFGHRAAMTNIKNVIRMSSDAGIEALTLFAFSTENWKRPKDEVSVIMSLLVEFLRKEMDELHEENVVFRAIGDIADLPMEVRIVLGETEEKTRNNTGLKLCVAVNYGSRREITEAVEAIAKKYKSGLLKKIDEQTVSDHLYTVGLPDPDLVIRTSGEQRISNFLLFQIAYAELLFTDTMWPDFTNQNYLNALLEYEHRSRRFGGIS